MQYFLIPQGLLNQVPRYFFLRSWWYHLCNLYLCFVCFIVFQTLHFDKQYEQKFMHVPAYSTQILICNRRLSTTVIVSALEVTTFSLKKGVSDKVGDSQNPSIYKGQRSSASYKCSGFVCVVVKRIIFQIKVDLGTVLSLSSTWASLINSLAM